VETRSRECFRSRLCRFITSPPSLCIDCLCLKFAKRQTDLGFGAAQRSFTRLSNAFGGCLFWFGADGPSKTRAVEPKLKNFGLRFQLQASTVFVGYGSNHKNFLGPERFGSLKTKNRCIICKIRLRHGNPNFRLRLHHLNFFGSDSSNPKLLGLHSPADGGGRAAWHQGANKDCLQKKTEQKTCESQRFAVVQRDLDSYAFLVSADRK